MIVVPLSLTLLSLVGGVYCLCRWRSRRAYHVVAREDTPWHEDGDTACATTGQSIVAAHESVVEEPSSVDPSSMMEKWTLR